MKKINKPIFKANQQLLNELKFIDSENNVNTFHMDFNDNKDSTVIVVKIDIRSKDQDPIWGGSKICLNQIIHIIHEIRLITLQELYESFDKNNKTIEILQRIEEMINIKLHEKLENLIEVKRGAAQITKKKKI